MTRFLPKGSQKWVRYEKKNHNALNVQHALCADYVLSIVQHASCVHVCVPVWCTVQNGQSAVFTVKGALYALRRILSPPALSQYLVLVEVGLFIKVSSGGVCVCCTVCANCQLPRDGGDSIHALFVPVAALSGSLYAHALQIKAWFVGHDCVCVCVRGGQQKGCGYGEQDGKYLINSGTGEMRIAHVSSRWLNHRYAREEHVGESSVQVQ